MERAVPLTSPSFGPPDDAPGDASSRSAEVLAALLATVAAAEPMLLADRLLAAYGSLGAVARAPRERVAALAGGAVADLLGAHRAAMLWTLREAALARPLVATRRDLLDYLHHRLAADPDETMLALFLNARRELVAEEVIARGDPAGVAVTPRTVIARALEVGATGLILVHNHPSGDPEPSATDRRFTRALAQAGRLLDVRLVDHLVVARDGHRRIAPQHD